MEKDGWTGIRGMDGDKSLEAGEQKWVPQMAQMTQRDAQGHPEVVTGWAPTHPGMGQPQAASGPAGRDPGGAGAASQRAQPRHPRDPAHAVEWDDPPSASSASWAVPKPFQEEGRPPSVLIPVHPPYPRQKSSFQVAEISLSRRACRMRSRSSAASSNFVCDASSFMRFSSLAISRSKALSSK